MKKNSFFTKKPKLGFIAFLMVICSFFTNELVAQNVNFFWGGGVNTSWTNAGNWSRTGRYVHTANFSAGATTVTIATANLQGTAPSTVLAVGDAIVGPGIPAGTTVVAPIPTVTNGAVINLSQATTASGSASIIQTYLKSTTTPYNGTSPNTATAVIDNAALTSPVVSTTGAVSNVVLLRNNFGLTTGPTLTIDTGGILTVTSTTGTPFSSAGGNILNNGTLSITSTATAISAGISCIVPTVAPSGPTEYTYSGSGALNINLSASTTANTAGINVTSLNANSTYKFLFDGTTNFNFGSAQSAYALRNAGGALISPLIIGGAGFTMGTVGSPVVGGLISVGAQSSVTVNSGTTLTLNSASNNPTSGILTGSSSTTATTFTNNGTINILGASTRSGLQFNTFTTGAALPINFINAGIINVDLNSSTVGSGSLVTGNGGSTATTTQDINLTNSGTLTLKNTSTIAGTGAAIFGLVAGQAPPVKITNNGTITLEGTSYSYGNKFTIDNNGILNSNSELRSFTAINNNSGGSINFANTAATATTKQVVFNGLQGTDVSGGIGNVYSDGTNNYVVVNQKFSGTGTTLVTNVLSSVTVPASGNLTLTVGSGGTTPLTFTSASESKLNGAITSTTTNLGTINTGTASNMNQLNNSVAASTGTIAPGGSGKGIVEFSSGTTLALAGTLKLNVSGSSVTGVDYDQITNSAAGGGFDLTGATLDISGIYLPSAYTVIDIITTNATGTLTGTFASVIGIAGTGWSVVYNSGTAGAVQLVRGTPATPTITRLSSNGTNTITSACEGSTLVIIGTNLTGISEITVDGVALTGVTDISSTRAEGVLPIGARVGTVTVTTPGGSVTTAGNLTVVENSTVVTAVTACDTYTWANNGQTYTTSGTYTGTTTGCVTQSLVLNIVTTPAPIVTNVTQCGGTYTWPANGVTYSASTNLTIIVGCTSETLNLTITAPTTTGSATVSQCGGTYTWSVNNVTYSSSQTVVVTSGCNTATLNLTITSPSTTGSETVSACGTSYTWALNGQTYNATGNYTHVVGCNTATLSLTLTPNTTTGSETVSQCGGTYTWPVNNVTYSSSQTVVVTSGCNTATLNLTITPLTTTGSETVSQCGGFYTWPVNNVMYTSSTTQVVTVGCNTATLNLTITAPTTTGSVTTTECGGYTWPENNVTYTSSTTEVVTNGCNTATLNLTITPGTTIGDESVSACGSSYTWATSGSTYNASGTYSFISGCNVATLTLILTPATTTGSETRNECGTSYTWPVSGQSYTTSGTYTHTVGCNTATLTLTLTPNTTTNSESVSACGTSYTWSTSGSTYNSSGTYTHVVGCNTATLTLLLTPATTTGSVTQSQCGGTYTWSENNVTYSSSQTVVVTSGCNTATLNLTITPLTTNGSVTQVQTGGTFNWAANGQSYSTSGIYTHVVGCNTATLDLTINPVPSQIPTAFAPFCKGATIATAKGSTSMRFYTAQTGGLALLSTTPLANAKTLWVSEEINSVETSRVSRLITVTNLPATPGAMTTTDAVICKLIGTTNQVTYTLATPLVPVSSYAWNLPSGVNAVGPTNGISITVNFQGASTSTLLGGVGTISARALTSPATGSCASAPRALVLTSKLPTAPSSLIMTSADTATDFNVSGVPTSLSQLTKITKVGPYMGTSTVFTLTAASAPTAASYAWTLPSGVVTSGSVTGNAITVNFSGVAPGVGTLPIVVKSVGGCGESLARTLTLSRALPTAPTALVLTESPSTTPLTKVGPYTGKTTQLTLTATRATVQGATATSYAWILPAGVNIVSPATTATTVNQLVNTGTLLEPVWTPTSFAALSTGTASTITIDFANVASGVFSFPLSVFAVNGTGNSKARTRTVTAAAPASPAIVSSPSTTFNSCSTRTYTATSFPGATYNWSVPAGATFTGGTGNVIVVDYSATTVAVGATAQVTCSASNGTGTSLAKIANVKRLACLAKLSGSSANAFKVTASPNPSSSEFTIETSRKGATSVEVYDMQGRLIENRKANTNTVQVGARLSAGTYNVVVKQDANVKTVRVVKK